MSDFELKLAELRAEADQEVRAEGQWAEITVPARLLLVLLDAVERKHNRTTSDHPQIPFRT